MTDSRFELLLHPIRMRIVLAITGKQMTTKQIATTLNDVPQASLYRHIKVLQEGGVLAIVDQNTVRGAVESVYAIPDKDALQIQGEEAHSLSKEEHLRYFTTFMTGIIGAFSRYTKQVETIDLEDDGVRYNTIPLYLSDEELASLQEDFRKLLMPLLWNEAGDTRKRRLLTTVILPDANDETKGN